MDTRNVDTITRKTALETSVLFVLSDYKLSGSAVRMLRHKFVCVARACACVHKCEELIYKNSNPLPVFLHRLRSPPHRQGVLQQHMYIRVRHLILYLSRGTPPATCPVATEEQVGWRRARYSPLTLDNLPVDCTLCGTRAHSGGESRPHRPMGGGGR